MKKEDMHAKVLAALEDHYLLEGIDKNKEFMWDGPSNWEKYESSKPKIVFLAKEAYASAHPSNQIKIHDRFTRNIARWASLIISILNNDTITKNPFEDNLQESYDSIAIVEIKKIDDNKTSSSPSNLQKFAWLGREFLKKQLEILEPNIIICCGTIDYFNIINNYSEEEGKQTEKEIFKIGGCNCLNSGNILVADFYHPSRRKKGSTDLYLFNLMKDIFLNKNVQSEYFKFST
jgi:hypothetical protein